MTTKVVIIRVMFSVLPLLGALFEMLKHCLFEIIPNHHLAGFFTGAPGVSAASDCGDGVRSELKVQGKQGVANIILYRNNEAAYQGSLSFGVSIRVFASVLNSSGGIKEIFVSLL